jgi:hypothetical protein
MVQVAVRNVTNKSGVVAHACNTSYVGAGDQEDHSSSLAQEKISYITS